MEGRHPRSRWYSVRQPGFRPRRSCRSPVPERTACCASAFAGSVAVAAAVRTVCAAVKNRAKQLSSPLTTGMAASPDMLSPTSAIAEHYPTSTKTRTPCPRCAPACAATARVRWPLRRSEWGARIRGRGAPDHRVRGARGPRCVGSHPRWPRAVATLRAQARRAGPAARASPRPPLVAAILSAPAGELVPAALAAVHKAGALVCAARRDNDCRDDCGADGLAGSQVQ